MISTLVAALSGVTALAGRVRSTRLYRVHDTPAAWVQPAAGRVMPEGLDGGGLRREAIYSVTVVTDAQGSYDVIQVALDAIEAVLQIPDDGVGWWFVDDDGITVEAANEEQVDSERYWALAFEVVYRWR